MDLAARYYRVFLEYPNGSYITPSLKARGTKPCCAEKAIDNKIYVTRLVAKADIETATSTKHKDTIQTDIETRVQTALDVLHEHHCGVAAFPQDRQTVKPEKHARSGGAGGSTIRLLRFVESGISGILMRVANEKSGRCF